MDNQAKPALQLNVKVYKEPVDYQKVYANLDLFSETAMNYYEQLYSNMQDQIPFGQSMRYSLEEFVRYMQTLVLSRVFHVRKDLPRPVVAPTDRIAVPAGLNVMLNSIGLVNDVAQGITIEPNVNFPNGFEAYSFDVMTKISSWLMSFTKLGFTMAMGYDKSKDGNFDFMCFNVVNDEVCCRDDERAPVYALMAAFLRTQMTETLLSYRVKYGRTDYFASIVRELAEPKSRS